MTVAWLVLSLFAVVDADSNLLSGANDIIVARNEDGQLEATPFTVQFGKADIWLPRSGNTVNIKLNGRPLDLSMTLDSEGRAYFSKIKTTRQSYNFWPALFGVSDPPSNQMTDRPTSGQLEQLNLDLGRSSLEFYVVTSLGSLVSIPASIFYLRRNSKLVISDIDGTITRSNVRGFLLPALGISDWKHDGVVQLYSDIGERGYFFVYLSARAIGQSESTRAYLSSLREGNATMPEGAIFLRKDSVIGAITTEVIKGNPEKEKIATLVQVRYVAGPSSLYAAYGNQNTDMTAYKALNIPLKRIFRMDEDSFISRVTNKSIHVTFDQHHHQVDNIYPANPPLYN